jgi:hypothetical protein
MMLNSNKHKTILTILISTIIISPNSNNDVILVYYNDIINDINIKNEKNKQTRLPSKEPCFL